MSSRKSVVGKLLECISRRGKEKVVAELAQQEKGGLTMSKKLLVGLLAVVFCLVAFQGVSHAASTDTCVISVQPPTEYSVQFSTAGGISFGTVVLGSTYIYTSAVSTVTNNGSVISDWKLRAAPVTAGEWTLTLRTGGINDAAVDQLNLAAVLQATGSAAPNNAVFANTDIIDGDSTDMDATNFENGADGDNVGAGEARNIWFRIKAPSATNYTGVQQFRVYVEAWASDTF